MTETNSEQPAAEPVAVDDAPPREAAQQEHVLPPWGSGGAPPIPSVDNDDDHVSFSARVLQSYGNSETDQTIYRAIPILLWVE